MRAGCFQSRYSHYHDMESICQIRTGFSIQTQHFCQYHSHKHPKSQYMHAPKPHQACCVDTVDQGKCTFSATQSVFVFIPESDGTDTAREIRYKTHRTYLAKSAFFIFPPSMRICWCYFSKCHPCSVKTKTKKKGLLLRSIWASCADLLIPQSMAEDVVHVLVQPLQATIPRPHVRVVGGQEALHCGLQAGQQLPVLLSGR